MKKRDFEEIKSLKPFEIGDVFLYVFLTVVVAVLFLVCLILPKTGQAKGFIITFDGKEIFSLEYSTLKYKVDDAYADRITVDLQNSSVSVFVGDKEYNQITFDADKKSVKVTDANCSTGKDCVHSPAVSEKGSIICVPHKLKISPLAGSGFTPPTVG